MKRYDIAQDFRKKFIEEHPNVWGETMSPVYFSITGDEAKVSKYHYSIEGAEHALVIFVYSYKVITQYDRSLVALFFHKNGEIEDHIIIDKWKIYFSPPKTHSFKSCTPYVYMEKDGLQASFKLNLNTIDNAFPRIWSLLSIIKECRSQIEINYIQKVYELEEEIDTLRSEKLREKAQTDALNMLLEAHKQLLQRIETLSGLSTNE